MNKRFVELLQKYLDSEISNEEKEELNSIINENEEFRKEFEEQIKVQEVLSKMKLKNPSSEFWDAYWTGLYNKIERGLAWIAISVGALILIAYGSIQAVEQFFGDTETPVIVKIGTVALVFGLLILLFSVLREKFYTSKRDKYKEIQR